MTCPSPARAGRGSSSTRSRSTRKGSSATRGRAPARPPRAAAGRHRARSATAPGRFARLRRLGHATCRGVDGDRARTRRHRPQHRTHCPGPRPRTPSRRGRPALVALAVVTAAVVWWELPGAIIDVTRTMVSGSVGKVGWLVPLMLVMIGWRNMRDPEHNGPAGRQVVGWASFAFGVLGIVHIAAGNPQPALGDTTSPARPLEAPSGTSCPACSWTCWVHRSVSSAAASGCSRSSACSSSPRHPSTRSRPGWPRRATGCWAAPHRRPRRTAMCMPPIRGRRGEPTRLDPGG